MHVQQVAFTEILGQVIRRHRQDQEITQDSIAPQLAVTASALSRIESGQVPLTVIQLRRIGERLGVRGSELLREAEELAAVHIPKASPGVRVVDERPKQSDAAGWFLGGAAIGALVTALFNEDQKKSKPSPKRPKPGTRK